MTMPNILLDRLRADQAGLDMSGFYEDIRAELEQVETKLEAWSRSANPVTAEVSRYVLRKRGKRLRPALVLLSSKLFGTDDGEGVFLASLVELIHTASLIHDDIIDNAETRRGKETVHAKWGPNITVLLGDYLYIKSIGLSLQSKHRQVIGLLSDVSARMIEGELDEYALCGDLGITEQQYLSIIDNKTAVLFSACCRIGAILGRASTDRERDIGEYGRHLGMCFQIIDDLLDFTGDEQVLGKPVLSDLSEGRVTLPLIHALNGNGGLDHDRIAGLLRRKDISGKEKKGLLDALTANGALAYTRAKAREFSERSLDLLKHFPEGDSRNALAGLARFVLARNR